MTIYNSKVYMMVTHECWLEDHCARLALANIVKEPRHPLNAESWDLDLMSMNKVLANGAEVRVTGLLMAPFLPRNIYKLPVYRKSCSLTSWYYTFCIDSLHSVVYYNDSITPISTTISWKQHHGLSTHAFTELQALEQRFSECSFGT